MRGRFDETNKPYLPWAKFIRLVPLSMVVWKRKFLPSLCQEVRRLVDVVRKHDLIRAP
jgi:hypothetical protein